MRLLTLLISTFLLVAIGCGGNNTSHKDSAEQNAEPAVTMTPSQANDRILLALQDARDIYKEHIVTAETALELEINAHIQELAEGGDPVLVQEAMADRDRFLSSRAMPIAPELEIDIEMYEQQVAKAEYELETQMQVAVEALTKSLRIDEALTLNDEMLRLRDRSDPILDTVTGIESHTPAPIPTPGLEDPEMFEGLGTDSPPIDGGTDRPDGHEGTAETQLPDENLAAPALPDPIADRLAVCQVAYEQAIEDARQVLLSRIDIRVAALRAADDEVGALGLSDQQVMFREHGLLPVDSTLQAAVRRFVLDSGRSLRHFTRPISDAVTAYYTDGQAEKGKTLETQLMAFRSTQTYYEAIAGDASVRRPQDVYRFDTTGERIHRIAVSGNGQYVAAWSTDRVLRVWSLATGQVVIEIDTPMPNVEWMSLSADGSVITLSSWSHSGTIWRLDGQLIADLDEHRERYNIVVSEDGKHFVMGGHYWTTIRGIDAQGLEVTANLGEGNVSSYSVAISSNAGFAAAAGWDKEIRLFDLESFKYTQTLVGTRQVYGICFSPAGTHLAAGITEKQIMLWDMKTMELSLTISGLPDVPRWMSMSSHGEIVLANLGSAWLFETESGRKLYEFGSETGFHVVTPNAGFVLSSDESDLILYRLPTRH